MSRGLKIIYIPEKNNRVENKSTEIRHRQRSGVHLEVFEQISEDMGQKKTPETLSQTGGDCLKSHTFLSENQEFVFGLVEGFGVL